MPTNIEWADESWNPIVGCSIVSPGCTNCYAMRMAARVDAMHHGLHTKAGGGAPFSPSRYAGLTQDSKAGPVWTGKVALAPDGVLTAPLRRRKPTVYFVNSMGDLFHENVQSYQVAEVFAVAVVAHLMCGHIFVSLTKRSQIQREMLNSDEFWANVNMFVDGLLDEHVDALDRRSDDARALVDEYGPKNPPPRLILGVSVERQPEADKRIPDLLATPAAKRIVSIEPMLGAIDLTPKADELYQRLSEWYGPTGFDPTGSQPRQDRRKGWFPRIDGVIVGGESGPGARPMHPDWPRAIRDQCAAAGVKFFFKQWGEWLAGEANTGQFGSVPMNAYRRCDNHSYDWPQMRRLGKEAVSNFGMHSDPWSGLVRATRVGKRRAGRLLDGVEHNDLPWRTAKA